MELATSFTFPADPWIAENPKGDLHIGSFFNLQV